MTHFEREIRSQPEVLEAVLAEPAIAEAAEALAQRRPAALLTLARGSSDNAVTFFAYLAGRYLGLPVASVPPSLLTVYDAPLKAADMAVVAVSQSGESPDVVQAMRALGRAGATTVAVSNVPDSPLMTTADLALPLCAGEERAVAATKTFSSQMMVLARLVAQWSNDAELADALRGVPAAMRELLDTPEATAAALRLTHADSAIVLGRGLSYAPALELALKLTETSYLQAQAFSSAEFQHGPIAALSPRDPVLLLAGSDATLAANLEVKARLLDLGADLTVVSSAAELRAGAGAAVALPAGLHPVAECFLQVLAGQLLALALAASRGADPDQPRHLNKITRTV